MNFISKIRDYDNVRYERDKLKHELEVCQNEIEVLKKIKTIREENPKLKECISEKCESCKFCVKNYNFFTGMHIIGCDKDNKCASYAVKENRL